jgi:hypothetical protein
VTKSAIVCLHLAILSLTMLMAVPTYAQGPGPSRAGLVIVSEGGAVSTACVEFDGESINGADLLRRSKVGVVLGVYGGLGYGVCAIGDVGCFGGEDCFCQCRSAPCAYWVYSHRQPDGSWAVSGVGASVWEVRDEDVDGWVWGDGSTAPPAVGFEQVCPSNVSERAEATAVPGPVETSPTVARSPSREPPATTPGSDRDAGLSGETRKRDDGSLLLRYGLFGALAVALVASLALVGVRARRTSGLVR